MMGNSYYTTGNKMELSQQFPADAEKASEGVWVDLGGLEFCLTYYNSTIAQLSLASNVQKAKFEEDKKAGVINAMHETLAEDIVLGWRNVQEDGINLVYSVEELRRVLKKYVGLDSMLMEASSDIENFKRDEQKATVKN